MSSVTTKRMFFAAITVLLGLIAVAYIQPGMFAPLNIYDEGIIVFGSQRVMQGELPYRDFWTQYSPGQLYVLAGLFKVFGVTIMVERWWDVIIRSLLALTMLAVSARLTSWKFALPMWVLAVMWIEDYSFFGYPIFAGLMFALASLYAMLRGYESRRWLFAAGILLGLCFTFRHDMAVYLGAAQIIGYAPAVFLRKTHEGDSLLKRVADTVRILLPYIAGAAVIMLPLIAYFVTNAPISELAYQLFIFPLVEFPKVRDLPYPRLNWKPGVLPFYAPWLIYGLALLIALITMIRQWKVNSEYFRAWGIVMVAMFGLFGFNQARVRSDTIHTVHFFLVALTLLPVLFRGWGNRVSAPAQVISSVAVLIAIIAVIDPVNGYIQMRVDRENAKSALSPDAQASALPRAAGALISPEQNFVAREIQRLTEPGEYVYIGLDQHDKIFANDVMLYFLIDRKSPTRYHELHPGLVNTEPVQREMIADLEKHKPRYVVTTDMFKYAMEPNDTSKSTNVKLLDRYLSKNYRYANTVGSYTIYKRREP